MADGKPQSTHIPRIPMYLSPRPNWDPLNPSPASSCVSPPRNQRGRGTSDNSPTGEGGRYQFRRLEKKPSTLSACDQVNDGKADLSTPKVLMHELRWKKMKILYVKGVPNIFPFSWHKCDYWGYEASPMYYRAIFGSG